MQSSTEPPSRLAAVPLVIGALMGLALLVAGILATVDELPKPKLAPQPKPAAWEIKAWADSHCDRCQKGLTADPQDGLYLVNHKPMWLHKGCAEAIRSHRNRVE